MIYIIFKNILNTIKQQTSRKEERIIGCQRNPDLPSPGPRRPKRKVPAAQPSTILTILRKKKLKHQTRIESKCRMKEVGFRDSSASAAIVAMRCQIWSVRLDKSSATLDLRTGSRMTKKDQTLEF